MTNADTKTLFLPGAGGSALFWNEIAQIAGIEGTFFAWPGLGDEPADAQTNSLDDLATMVLGHITSPVDIVAQSMGGVVAIKVALAMPKMVRRLVLTVTSGGLPMEEYGGSCWRADYFATYPLAASWIADPIEDLSQRIPSIQAPTLLLWGDADPISPVAVGERLQNLMPNAHLRVLAGAGHDLAQTHAEAVAEAIQRHLQGRTGQIAGT
jgi:pimeloyl-ACP methyl ester carboxylesterase